MSGAAPRPTSWARLVAALRSATCAHDWRRDRDSPVKLWRCARCGGRRGSAF